MNMRTTIQIAIILFSLGCDNTELKDDWKVSAEADKAAEMRLSTILEEVKSLSDHPWAGKYYEGDGTGTNISFTLAPKAGYLFELHGCLGLYDRNYGSVTQNAGSIRVDYTLKNDPDSLGIAQEHIIVPWGKRHYLIPPDTMIDFCNAINNGHEPRDQVYGMFLLREGDEKIFVTGFPVVPTKYRPYLLAEPIDVDIIAVGESQTLGSSDEFKYQDTNVTLNKGSKNGLLVGMEFVVVKPDDNYESVKITKVEANQSEGIMSQMGNEIKVPQVGWKLSTRPTWSR